MKEYHEHLYILHLVCQSRPIREAKPLAYAYVCMDICIYIHTHIFFQLRDLVHRIALIWHTELLNYAVVGASSTVSERCCLCFCCWSLDSAGLAAGKGIWAKVGDSKDKPEPMRIDWNPSQSLPASTFDDANVLPQKVCFYPSCSAATQVCKPC